MFYLDLLRLICYFFFFLMIRRPPRSTLDRSSAASDVYKRQSPDNGNWSFVDFGLITNRRFASTDTCGQFEVTYAVSYTHLRAHETVLDIVCRLLLEKKKNIIKKKTNKKKNT